MMPATLTGKARKNKRTLSEEDSARLLFFRSFGQNGPNYEPYWKFHLLN